MALLALAAAAGGTSAHAEFIDLGTFRCKTYLAGDKGKAALILMWLDGYYSEEGASPIVDFDRLKSHTSRFDEYCAKNPNRSLINAADELLAK